MAEGEKSVSRPRLVGYLGSIRAPYSSEGGSAEDILKGGQEGQEEGAELFIAAQQFHTQRDAPMPLPREDAKVSSVDWRIKDVLLVDIVIAVSRKNLKRKKKKVNHMICSDVSSIFFTFTQNRTSQSQHL